MCLHMCICTWRILSVSSVWIMVRDLVPILDLRIISHTAASLLCVWACHIQLYVAISRGLSFMSIHSAGIRWLLRKLTFRQMLSVPLGLQDCLGRTIFAELQLLSNSVKASIICIWTLPFCCKSFGYEGPFSDWFVDVQTFDWQLWCTHWDGMDLWVKVSWGLTESARVRNALMLMILCSSAGDTYWRRDHNYPKLSTTQRVIKVVYN